MTFAVGDPGHVTEHNRVAGLVVTPEMFGAVGNGSTDDQTAIASALAAVAPGGTVVFGSGKTYAHSGTLTVGTPGVTLTGGGALKATTPAACALKVTANWVTVESLELYCANVTVRLGGTDTYLITLLDAAYCTFRDLYLHDGPAASFLSDGGSYYTVTGCRVVDGLADAFHNTGGSHHANYTDCHVYSSGDDGFAVVGYEGDGQPYEIRISDCSVHGTDARGVAVVGGRDVTVTDVIVSDTVAAGFYVASEPGYSTYGVDNVLFDRCCGYGCNTGVADHGTYFIYSGRATTTVSDVTLRDCEAWNTAAAHEPNRIVQEAGATAPSNIRFERCIVNGTGSTVDVGGNYAPTLRDITVGDTAAASGMALLASAEVNNANTSGVVSWTGDYAILQVVVQAAGFGTSDYERIRLDGNSSAVYAWRIASYNGTAWSNTSGASATSAALENGGHTTERVFLITMNNDPYWYKSGSVAVSRAERSAATPGDIVVGTIQYEVTGVDTGINSVEVFSNGGNNFNWVRVQVFGKAF